MEKIVIDERDKSLDEMLQIIEKEIEEEQNNN